MFNVTATLTLDVPEPEVGTLVGALLAAVPSDITGATGEISETTPSTVAGNLTVTGNLTATMSQGDIGRFLTAVEAAIPADATLVSGSVSFAPTPEK